MSVILAAFNGQAYLRSAIDSILAQQFEDFEFLIVDDGSTDSTHEILLSYTDPRIRLLTNGRNQGLTRSLNLGLAEARGEYVARQDADDVSETDRLGAQVAYLERHPEVALLGSSFTCIDADGQAVRRTSLPLTDFDLRWSLFFFCPFVHSAVMWRREPVREHVGDYDERWSYAQDHQLWARIAARFAIANLPAFLVRYREHPDSMTAIGGAAVLEGLHLHVAAVSEALAWNAADEERLERFRAMAALLRPSQTLDMTWRQASQGADDVIALQRELCRLTRARTIRCRRHGRAVRASVSRGLVRAGWRSADQGRAGDAGRMLAAAYRTYWPTLAHRSAARLASRLLANCWLASRA